MSELPATKSATSTAKNVSAAAKIESGTIEAFEAAGIAESARDRGVCIFPTAVMALESEWLNLLGQNFKDYTTECHPEPQQVRQYSEHKR